MLEKLKQGWHDFERDAPGQRFQQRYERRRRRGQSIWRKAVIIGAGILIMAAGLFFLVAPGPGLLVVFIGGSLIAQESLFAARALDWLEVRLRQLARWGLAFWRRAPLAVKIVVVVLALILGGASTFATYLLLFAK
jgi:uncharacterized protein (TIGR02611 family)